MIYDHVVITKFGLGIFSDQWFHHRFKLLEAFTFPSIVNQTESNFKWVFLVDENAPKIVFEKLEQYKKSDNRISYIKRSLIKENAIPENFFSLLDLKKEYVLTSRIDDDDAIALDTFEIVNKNISYSLLNDTSFKGGLFTFENGLEVDLIKETYAPFSHPSLAMGTHLLLPASDKRTVFSFSHSNIAKKDLHDNEWKHFVCESGFSSYSWLYVRHTQADSIINKAGSGYKVINNCDINQWVNNFGVNPSLIKKYLEESFDILPVDSQNLVNSEVLKNAKFKKNKKPTALMVRDYVIKRLRALNDKQNTISLNSSELKEKFTLEQEYYRLGTDLFSNMDSYDFYERCSLLKKAVKKSGDNLHVKTGFLDSVKFAFYLIQDGNVCERVSYGSSPFHIFKNIDFTKKTVVKFYYKNLSNEKVSFVMPLDFDVTTSKIESPYKSGFIESENKTHPLYDFFYKEFQGVSYFFKEAEASRKLLVTFHGSISPPKNGNPSTPLPVFRLHNINIINQPNILCFSDKLLDNFKNDSVYLSWFLETSRCRQSSAIISVIEYYCSLYNFDEIIFHGSSGGGFPSVLFASHFGQTAIVSNSQFILEKHSQFKDLNKAVKAHDDKLLSYDLNSVLSDKVGPQKIISYCNIDDYTLMHHEYANETINSLFPGTVHPIFFSGDSIAKEKGVRNHSVQYPGGVKFNAVLSSYLNGKILK